MGWHPGEANSSTSREPGNCVMLHAAAAGITVVGQSSDELGTQLLSKRVCELYATMRRLPRRLPAWLTGVLDQLEEANQRGEWIAGAKLAQKTTLALEVLIVRAYLQTTPSSPSTQPTSRLAPPQCSARTHPRPRGRRYRRRRSSSSSRRSSGDGSGDSDGEPSPVSGDSWRSAEPALHVAGRQA